MINEAEILKGIAALERKAQEILDLKKKSLPRRSIVIEFCGSPKSGKSSCITSLDIFLRRNNFRTKVLTERASVCPISNKFDPLFNIWTSCSALAQLCEMVANHSRHLDIIILDRGIFDALCWFDWEASEGYLSGKDYAPFVTFFSAPRWRSIIDLVFCFEAAPQTSMDREYKHLLTRKEGSVMQKKVLSGYLAALRRSRQKYGELFRNVVTVDTTTKQQNQVSYEVTEACLNKLMDVTKERVAHFEAKHLRKVARGSSFRMATVERRLPRRFEFSDRDLVEARMDLLQPIPIALLKDRSSFSFLIARKRQDAVSERSPEKGRILLYFGGHVREEDSAIFQKPSIREVLGQALFREVKEELGLDIDVRVGNQLCIWLRNGTKSEQHMAVVFVVERDLEHLKLAIDEREFVRTSKDFTGSIISGSDILDKWEEIDDWSETAIQKLYPKQLSDIRAKRTLTREAQLI